jgi:hypothetical protein
MSRRIRPVGSFGRFNTRYIQTYPFDACRVRYFDSPFAPGGAREIDAPSERGTTVYEPTPRRAAARVADERARLRKLGEDDPGLAYLRRVAAETPEPALSQPALCRPILSNAWHPYPQPCRHCGALFVG